VAFGDKHLFQGSALVSRADPDRDRLAASIDAALDGLCPQEKVRG